MGAAAGPKVVNDGLVFAMDQANTEKSWKGAPTTNLRPDATFNSMNSIIHTYIETDAEGWKKYSLSGTWSAGTYPYCSSISSVTFTLGTYYSTGVYIKCNCMDKFFYKWTGMNYVNVAMNDGGTSFSIPQPDGSLFVGRRGFNYTTTTTQTGYFLNRPLADGTVFDPSTDFVWMKDPQIELGNFCTPFTASTRSNTEAIEDLTGNNTITASSLTYNADGSFEFNGTSDYFTIPAPAIGTSPNNWTICGWLRPATGGAAARFITPSSNGIDQWIGWSNNTVTIVYTQSADVGGRSIGSPANSAPVDTWIHFAAQISNLDVKLYTNGALAASSTETVSIGNWTGTWRIGQRGNSTGWLKGNLDLLQTYNRALTAAEVKQNFEATRSRYGI